MKKITVKIYEQLRNRGLHIYLVVNGVKLGQNNAIDNVRILVRRIIGQSLVEFNQLIYGFISYEGFSNEQYEIRLVNL